MMDTWLGDKMSGFPVRAFYYFLPTLAVISPRPLEAHINGGLSSGLMSVGPNFCFRYGSYWQESWGFGGFFWCQLFFCLLFFLPSSAASSTAGWEPLGTPCCSSSWFLGLCWCQHVIAKCYGCNVSSDVQCQIGPLCKDVQRTREFWGPSCV